MEEVKPSDLTLMETNQVASIPDVTGDNKIIAMELIDVMKWEDRDGEYRARTWMVTSGSRISRVRLKVIHSSHGAVKDDLVVW
ncbi:hypothetical protein L1887_34731 [Cichorium endivia]|nr:hypothetical protein L1887_34731 [Cichorium endivia]